MKSNEELSKLAHEFAIAVEQQTEAIRKGDAPLGNKHAKRYIKASKELRTEGDVGREAMVPLLRHARADVRVMAAAYLLRYCTAEALKVLEDAAKGEGLAALGASLTIKRWEDGTWHLDPP